MLPDCRSHPTATTAQLIPDRKKGGTLALAMAARNESQSKRLGERGRERGMQRIAGRQE